MGQDHIEWVFDDAKSTIISRGEERDQDDGERTIPRCVTAFNAITGHNLSNCDGWLFMEVLKKCRSVQGKYKYDDYRDGVGYAALRAEEARMEHEVEKGEALFECVHGFTRCSICVDWNQAKVVEAEVNYQRTETTGSTGTFVRSECDTDREPCEHDLHFDAYDKHPTCRKCGTQVTD